MSDSKPIYLSSVRDGFVLTFQDSGKPWLLTIGYAGDRPDAEKWVVDPGDEPDTVALKSTVNGEYSTGELKDRGKVNTTDAKQWWKVEYDLD